MKNNLYKNYFKNHNYNFQSISYDKSYHDLERNIGLYFNKYSLQSRIVEIGSGQGKFADYCHKKGYSNYMGFELDTDIIHITQKKFPHFSFRNDDVVERLKMQKGTIDILFMSHVFEHFPLSDGLQLSALIYNALAPGGVWINIMPNASAPFNSGYSRYNDITHQILYTENSFNQVLLSSGYSKKHIIHHNTIKQHSRYFSLFSKFFYLLIRALYASVKNNFPRIYSFEIYSFIKK